MKRLATATIVLSFLPCLIAQDMTTHVRYRTVAPGQGGEYVQGERGFWKPAHEEASKGGGLHYWAVLVRAAPYGPALPHHAMTLNITKGDYSMGTVVGKMRKDKAMDKLFQQTGTASKLHHGEQWRLIEEAWGDSGDIGEDDEVYAVVNYIKTRPGKAGEYRQLERDWQKIHAEAVKAGAMRGWQAFRVQFPGGAEADYNFVTINYRNGPDLGGRIAPEYFKKSHPGKDWEAFARQTGEARVIVRRELYRVTADLRP